MKFIISLDYELFFGSQTGSVERCLTEPTSRIVEVLERYQGLLTLFVDASFLVKLARSPVTMHRQQLRLIREQLRSLARAGHDIQLHIHPHWEDSIWANDHWQIETQRYRLHDFDATTRRQLVATYADELESSVGLRANAFRAGGWCLQPFSDIADALHDAGITVDSTVYAGGRSTNPGREFDFRNAPEGTCWRFDTDPLSPAGNGRFLEIAISACAVSPLTYWRAAAQRLVGRRADHALGDGMAMQNTGGYYMRKLFWPETAVASVDGARVSYLEAGWKMHAERGSDLFNVMGHPKSLTVQSLEGLDSFLRRHRGDLEPTTIRLFADRMPDQGSM